MKWIVAGLVLAGLVAALCAALLVAGVRANNVTDMAISDEAPTEVEVIVASRGLPAMSIVDANAITTRTVMSDEIDEGACRNYTSVIGQVVIRPMVEGEVFDTDVFASEDSGVHLAATLTEGHLAMSVMLADDTGITDLLYPGSVVDVIASFRLPSSFGVASGEVLSATLLQGVQVIAIGPKSIVTRDSDADENSLGLTPAIDRKQRRRVTFMVDPDQAEALQMAMSHGELAVAMRNPLDLGKPEGRGVLLTDLSEGLAERLARMSDPGDTGEAIELTDDRPVVRNTDKPEVWQTVVMRGLTPETLTFPAVDDK